MSQRMQKECPKCRATMLQSKKLKARFECGRCGFGQPVDPAAAGSKQAWFTSRVIR